MKRTIIDIPSAPKAIGPYSQGVRTSPWIFFSGQIGIDPSTGKLVDGGIEAQTSQILQNIRALLESQNVSSADVVKTTVYLTDLTHFQVMNNLYGNFFPSPYPARTTVQVSGLPLNALVEIEVLALTRD